MNDKLKTFKSIISFDFIKIAVEQWLALPENERITIKSHTHAVAVINGIETHFVTIIYSA